MAGVACFRNEMHALLIANGMREAETSIMLSWRRSCQQGHPLSSKAWLQDKSRASEA